MSANAPPVIEVSPENNHLGGPFINTNRIRNNNNQNPLFNVRDRLFHTLFYRAALAYARTFPRPLRRFLEFLTLIKAIAAFFVLMYIHITFSRTPSTCLNHVKDTWPRDGILRVEIVRNVGKDYNIEQSYAKEEKLKQQGKVEDFSHVIGLLARDGFVNIEPTAVEDSSKETEPLQASVEGNINSNAVKTDEHERKLISDALLNVSKMSPTLWDNYQVFTDHPIVTTEKSTIFERPTDRVNNDSDSLFAVTNVKQNVIDSSDSQSKAQQEHEYIVEFALEYGFLRLSPATRTRLKIPVEIVTLDPARDECFGDPFSRLLLEEFLGYDDLLLASIKTLAESEDNKGYLRNVVSGEHYRFVSMWMARTSYFAAFFIMIVFVNDIRALQYQPDGSVFYKLRFKEEWRLLPQRRELLQSKEFDQLPILHSNRLLLTARKFQDLQDLKATIPSDYHSYYNNLPHK